MKKQYHIELVRFILSLLIVYYHILHSCIIPYVGENEVYLKLQNANYLSSLIVECFALMGGFFLYNSYERNMDKSYLDFFIEKIVRLWPVLAFYTLFCIAYGVLDLENALFDLTFLRSTGISLNNRGIIWYIGPYFWSILLVFAILKYCKKGVSSIILAVITYWAYTININTLHGGLGRDMAYTVVNLGLLKILADVSLGCLIALILSAFRAAYNTGTSSAERVFSTILASTAEILSLVGLLLILVTSRFQISNKFTVVILFSMFLICASSGQGIFSRLANRRIFGILGRYCYSIYVMQQISFYILRDTLWQHTQFLNDHIIISLTLSVALCVVIGILTYHLIEKPAVSLFKRWRAAHSSSQPA